ncbi:MAG: Unknown protein [uncultured Sulfurovum sp.]|uniref:Uncharacterized protein n=1 Tax=uncultured Sulfurovum sp. TaxID=269237 RepID=A0A6S6S897_9BACT|nr:MAG: Unknown protein [uncultured Sulfurovum sp.]
MIPNQQLHQHLMEACKTGNVNHVKNLLASGAEPNFNIKTAINALDVAIQIDHHQIIELLLEYGAIVKGAVLQRAIEKNKHYFHLLIPNFKSCKEETLLMAVLQAAMNIDDLHLAKQAIDQGAKPKSLFLFAIQDFGRTEILELLIENGFDIHANNNMLLTEWMGSCLTHEWGRKRAKREDFLVFISEYYLEKPSSIEKFKSWRQLDKLRLFRLGLSMNNITMMKFAFQIGADENEALNSALHRYYAHKKENSTHSKMFKNHHYKAVDYEILEYMLNTNITFKKISISNAICFKYTVLLKALSRLQDLEYAYEMAYHYEDDDYLLYFSKRGVSKDAQSLAKMKVSAIKGNIKTLQNAVNDGAKVTMLNINTLVEIINKNQVASLKYLYEAGLSLDPSLNAYLDEAMNQHKAYESVSYLIELGLDITHVKKLPLEYEIKYPSFADMRKKRFKNIFDYTLHLVKEVHPKVEGKEKEEVLKSIAQLSSLPYVIKMSKEKSFEH